MVANKKRGSGMLPYTDRIRTFLDRVIHEIHGSLSKMNYPAASYGVSPKRKSFYFYAASCGELDPKGIKKGVCFLKRKPHANIKNPCFSRVML